MKIKTTDGLERIGGTESDHSGGPHIGAQRMKGDLSTAENVQPLCEFGARLAVFSDDLAEIHPLGTGRLRDQLALFHREIGEVCF